MWRRASPTLRYGSWFDLIQRLRNGTVVSALVAGSGTTLKHFHRQGATVVLEAANPAYQPIELPAEQVEVQGRLVAVWRQV